jgi:hypothetical protein
MKAQSFVVLILVLVVFASCKSSTETNGPLQSYSLVKPKVGSVFVYQQLDLDSNGDALPEQYRTDTVWTVIAADTSLMGHSHVWLLGSSYMENTGYYDRYFAISYLANGDLDFSQDVSDFGSGLPWIRMPLASNIEQVVTLDTTIDSDSSAIHVHETWSTSNAGTTNVTLGRKSFQSVMFSTKIVGTATSAQSPFTADIHGTDNWTFIPELGYFSRHELREASHDLDGNSSGDGERMVLQRYELK